MPNVGLVIGLVTHAVLALLVSSPREAILVVMTYLVIKTIFQAIIQPKVVGDAVDLSPTLTFVGVISWGGLLGALGALLAVPLTLLEKALLIDSDPAAGWLVPLLSGSGGRKNSGEYS
ncbi:conserved membrane protein [Stigmatella aurantiaca DW4/3-1]|uniref:Conserved membrane protein n=1 Tax=Stigmatella aurantiaca (strain DW4/3-1) TaxID=378806 RepID=Q08TK8_STIAD|nr:conserved membrane protein [Stigmatella aurantiaca DW4/3-1]